MSNITKQTIIISLIVGLLALLGGYFFGQTKLISDQNLRQTDNSSQIKVDSFSDDNVKINSLSGIVKKINDNNIILKINESDERTVEIDNDTKIYILEEKSPEQYQKEIEEYNKKTQEQTSNQLEPEKISAAPLTLGLSPEVFAKKIGSMADIQNGITITAVAADKDIKNAKQFTAAEIIIPPAPNAADSSTIPPIK